MAELFREIWRSLKCCVAWWDRQGPSPASPEVCPLGESNCLRCDFEDRATAVSLASGASPERGHSDQHLALTQHQAGTRTAAIAAAAEGMELTLFPRFALSGWVQLKNASASAVDATRPSAVKGCAIQIARLIENHAALGSAAVDAPGPRKAVQQGLFPCVSLLSGWREFEDCALGVLLGEIPRASRAHGHPVQIPRRIENQAAERGKRTVVVASETMDLFISPRTAVLGRSFEFEDPAAVHRIL